MDSIPAVIPGGKAAEFSPCPGNALVSSPIVLADKSRAPGGNHCIAADLQLN